MTSREENCQICGKTPDEHQQLENQGILHHRWSGDGGLETIGKPENTQKRAEVMVVPGVDLLLRQLLVSKGIIDESDLAGLGAVGFSSSGDRANRPDQDAE